MTNLAAPHEALRDARRDDPTTEFEAYRVELTGYCYRMLGSVFEAEDAVQETMLRAWRGIDRFEGRSPLRSWLYRIATNVCLDLLHGRQRRAMPMGLGPSSTGEIGTELSESTWLQPVPSDMVLSIGADPADVAASRATVRLAFVAALQHLPPRQRAVLILRDVLAWPATEVAELLGTTATAVHSALARARVTLAETGTAPATPLGADELALLDRYVDAFERSDIESLVALLHEDATMSMPPVAYWFQGRAVIEEWWHGGGSECVGSRLVPTESNGGPALGLYRPTPGGGFHAFGIQIVEVSDDRISGIHTFIDTRLFPLFGLPDRIS